MNNFCYYSPTKYVFGKGEENNVGQYMKELGSKKVLIVYGGKSAEKSGLLGRVRESLKKADVAYVELWTCCWLWAAVAWRILPSALL